jgi:hypothetical protein
MRLQNGLPPRLGLSLWHHRADGPSCVPRPASSTPDLACCFALKSIGDMPCLLHKAYCPLPWPNRLLTTPFLIPSNAYANCSSSILALLTIRLGSHSLMRSPQKVSLCGSSLLSMQLHILVGPFWPTIPFNAYPSESLGLRLPSSP